MYDSIEKAEKAVSSRDGTDPTSDEASQINNSSDDCSCEDMDPNCNIPKNASAPPTSSIQISQAGNYCSKSLNIA